MPGPRRGVFRAQSSSNSTSAKVKVDSTNSSSTQTTLTSPTATQSTGNEFENVDSLPAMCLQPKHAHIPEIPVDSNLLFETMVFVFCTIALGMQYINLYKTVWWLPHSNANYALNFYLIDPYLTLLLVIIMSRRVVYCFVTEITVSRSRHACFYWLLQLVKLSLLAAVYAVFLFAAFQMIINHSLLDSLFLCYPLVTYVVLFGFDLRPLFGRALPAKSQTQASPEKSSSGTPKHRQRMETVSRDMPAHVCSMCPETVREEVEMLKTDFNSRIKLVLFSSMLCAYYVGFVPLWFAQNTLYYDTWWVGQHVGLVWVSCFVLFMVHLLPAKYVDVLHRCSLHLGHWVKVEGRHAHVPYNAWSELQVWQQGALVKHVRGLFKAEGINNSAEPGNSMHNRFYFVFHSPLRVVNWLLVITWSLIIYEFVLLIQATEWSHILSLAFLLFCNYYMLFKLMRDRFLLVRSYKEEQTPHQQ